MTLTGYIFGHALLVQKDGELCLSVTLTGCILEGESLVDLLDALPQREPRGLHRGCGRCGGERSSLPQRDPRGLHLYRVPPELESVCFASA